MTRDLWTSISAFTEAKGRDGRSGCLRRWAFRRHFKLPVAPKQATAFGDVFHAVLQRFYSADDRGLVDGRPVNLYPDGWKIVPDRFGRKDDTIIVKPEITMLEEMQIKCLVDKAINDGVLVRTPGRLVEQPFPDTVLKTHLATGSKMVLKGFIDLETPLSVEDHKTVKSKKWALPLKALETDAQMLSYAKIKYTKGHKGNLWLIHNNFIKDAENPEVLRREIQVEPDYVEDYYLTTLLPGFSEMFDIFLKYSKTDVGRWKELPGPIDTEKECNHYYGGKCPFSCVCSGSCDIPMYLDIFKELNEQIAAEKSSNLLPKETLNNITPNNITKGNNTMVSLMDRIKAGNAAAMATPAPASPPTTTPAPVAPVAPSAGLQAVLAAVKAKAAQAAAPVAATASAPSPAPAPVVAPVVPPAPTPQAAPWYQPGCQACSTNEYQGFNSKGSPCQVCDNMASLANKPISAMYNWTCDDAGKLVFSLKEAPAPVAPVTPVVTPPAAPVAQVAPVVAPVQTTPVIPTTPAPAPAEVKPRRTRTKTQTNTDAVAVAEQAAPEKPEPVANGFSLLIGVTYAKGFPQQVVSADDLVKASLDHLTSVGGTDVTTMDHFTVMQALDVYIPTLAQSLTDAGAVVISMHPTKGTALARVLDGLRPFAKDVLVAMGG